MEDIQKAKEFIIKYALIGEDYTDESCDESIKISLINCAKLLVAYSKMKNEKLLNK